MDPRESQYRLKNSDDEVIFAGYSWIEYIYDRYQLLYDARFYGFFLAAPCGFIIIAGLYMYGPKIFFDANDPSMWLLLPPVVVFILLAFEIPHSWFFKFRTKLSSIAFSIDGHVYFRSQSEKRYNAEFSKTQYLLDEITSIESKFIAILPHHDASSRTKIFSVYIFFVSGEKVVAGTGLQEDDARILVIQLNEALRLIRTNIAKGVPTA